MPRTKVSILGKESIIVGTDVLDFIPSDLKGAVKASRFALITDENVGALYLDKVKTIFSKCGLELLTRVIPAGEGTKCRASKEELENWLLESRCNRDTCLISLGGGVVGDLTGFVAATLLRGVPFVQIPTTLLAMVDASIGGKTGVDTMHGKNLIGAFHQPAKVYIDLNFLSTLPERQFFNGMAEVIKTAAIWDANTFAYLEQHSEQIAQRRLEDLYTIVLNCARVKAEVVTADEKESSGLRELLNYGHSMGHAVEALTQPGMLHGEAIAIGMVKEAQLARFLGYLSPANVGRLTRCIQDYHLPTAVPSFLSLGDLMEKMAVDKKNKGGKKYIVLLKTLGECAEKKGIAVADEIIELIFSHTVTVSPPKVPSTSGVTPCSITVPGSKSICNRALLLAALGRGRCELQGLLLSEDTQVMLDALSRLGCARFEWKDDARTLVVEGGGGAMHVPSAPLHLGNSGTASRFLTTLCTLARGEGFVTLTGIDRLHERPIAELVDSLRKNGCSIEYQGKQGSLPLKIAAGGLRGGKVNLSAKISSQYVSSILMAAPYAQQEVTLQLEGTVVSPLYIEMTIKMMASFGVQVKQTQPGCYVIPRQSYANPKVYTIEADASSATYPLAVAAISGRSIRANRVTASSIQGDAHFYKLLERMGCSVSQDMEGTTVTGPARGVLKPITVDMGDLTDAFMTAAVLAAVAPGVSRITGIANQRVKESDRISAMATELAKCGVRCLELPDGLEIHGQEASALHGAAVECYNDHRIAMSFAVLGCKVPGIVILDKDCVEKTYPEFWDDLRNVLGYSVTAPAVDSHSKDSRKRPSNGANGIDEPAAKKSCCAKSRPTEGHPTVLLIGMRGAGKTFLGKAAASALALEFVDMDDCFERKHGAISSFVASSGGWPKFRAAELELLRETLRAHPVGAVVATGGGIVETPEGRAELKKWNRVIEIRRDISDVCAFLSSSGTRPSLGEPPEEVFRRRDPLYVECSSLQFCVAKGDQNYAAAAKDFVDFLRLTMFPAVVEEPVTETPGFFLCLTFPDLTTVVPLIPTVVAGCHAVELRVDLLQHPTDKGFIASQLAMLRRHCSLPVIYTVRSKGQGGKADEDEAKIFDLLHFGVRLGCEYVDMETCWSSAERNKLLANKGFSKILASFHDPLGRCSWPEMKLQITEASHNGKADVVKIVGTARSIEDVFELRKILTQVEVSQPVIALCMGEAGKLSRVLNTYLTPVTHPALPSKAAPGQLSVAEIFAMRHSLGLLPARRFHLFGHPIRQSMSPTLHNTGFTALGLPHHYVLSEGTDLGVVRAAMADPSFGGASVTIPHKQAVLPLMQQLSPSAKAIGAVNTIIPLPDGRFLGDNTDWLAMKSLILDRLATAAGKPAAKGLTGLVLGAGGTARAAMYVMLDLGLSRRYIYNRTLSKAKDLAAEFSGEAVPSLEGLGAVDIIIGTIPASAQGPQTVPPGLLHGKPVVVDLAYRPRRTPLLKQAEAAGCATVQGIELLIAQGLVQFRRWTGCPPPAKLIEEAVIKAYEASE
eukprot:RCo037837